MRQNALHAHTIDPAIGHPRFVMPHERSPQARTWMCWPVADYMLGGAYAPAHEVWRAWAGVANTISEYQPITMLVSPRDLGLARTWLSSEVELVEAAFDDAWARDSGPTFVQDKTAGGALTAISWQFNAWGGLEFADTRADNLIAAHIAELAGAPVVRSSMVNEGGGMHVDGLGTVLITETVQLDPKRNPALTHAQVEAELANTIGARKVIWIPRGLYRDYGALGTRGHVDMMATFSEPGVVLVHDQQHVGHPDFALSRALLGQLADESDASGQPLTRIPLPAPQTLRDRDDWVDYNYVNHAVINGAVIMCEFDDPNDAVAREILRDAYPGRDVRGVDARAIFALGGGIHCITQQQPLANGPSPLDESTAQVAQFAVTRVE